MSACERVSRRFSPVVAKTPLQLVLVLVQLLQPTLVVH
jgi:hypothetical protein